MCTKTQLNRITQQISQYYYSVYGDNIVAIYMVLMPERILMKNRI